MCIRDSQSGAEGGCVVHPVDECRLQIPILGVVFGVWVIEGPAELEDKLPFKKAGVNVMVVPDVTTYKMCIRDRLGSDVSTARVVLRGLVK